MRKHERKKLGSDCRRGEVGWKVVMLIQRRERFIADLPASLSVRWLSATNRLSFEKWLELELSSWRISLGVEATECLVFVFYLPVVKGLEKSYLGRCLTNGISTTASRSTGSPFLVPGRNCQRERARSAATSMRGSTPFSRFMPLTVPSARMMA